MKNTYYFKNAWGMTRKRASKSVLLMSISFTLLMLTSMQGYAQRQGNVNTETRTDMTFISYEGNRYNEYSARLENLWYRTNNRGMGFYTNNGLRMALDNSGRLGIGTSSPGARLDVHTNQNNSPQIALNGGFSISTVFNNKDVVFRNMNQLRFTDSNDWDWNSWAGLSYKTGERKLVIGGSRSGYFNRNGGGVDVAVIFDGVSNVGIGKANPSAKLDVAGTGAFSNKLTVAAGGLEVSGASSFNNEVTVNSTFNTDALNVSGASSFNNEVTVNSTFNAGALNVSGASSFNNEVTVNSTFNTSALNVSGVSSFDDQVMVNSTFTADILNVSGISSFSNNLTVGGSSQAANVRVHGTAEVKELHIDPTETWADHVFEENYELKPLTEVEKFIRENHHLPEVPSAKEVSENGYNQSEVNAILLQKIEELTLYIITLEKQINDQKK